MSVALLCALAAGVPLSWNKTTGGAASEWIGALVALSSDSVKVTIPPQEVHRVFPGGERPLDGRVGCNPPDKAPGLRGQVCFRRGVGPRSPPFSGRALGRGGRQGAPGTPFPTPAQSQGAGALSPCPALQVLNKVVAGIFTNWAFRAWSELSGLRRRPTSPR